MIDQGHALSLTRQCEILELSRASQYYEPSPLAARDLVLMRRIDKLHLEFPFYGSRRLRGALRDGDANHDVVEGIARAYDATELDKTPIDPFTPRLKLLWDSKRLGVTFNYSCDILVGAYNYLDLTPKGRNETGPHHDLRDWVRHHDRYGDT